MLFRHILSFVNELFKLIFCFSSEILKFHLDVKERNEEENVEKSNKHAPEILSHQLLARASSNSFKVLVVYFILTFPNTSFVMSQVSQWKRRLELHGLV